MGNNGGLLLCIIITHYYIRIMSCVHVIMSSFWHIITYYYMLLHIAAFLLLAPCVMSWQVPGPAHHIYWIPQMMMFWSPTRLSQKPCGAVDLRCSSATMDGSTRRDCAQGPAGCDYEQERKHSGLHLFFILLFQMHMRDSLHQIDYGVIIHILQAILCLFYGKNM